MLTCGRLPVSLLDRCRRWYEDGDPLEPITEILGYPTTPDIEAAVEALEANRKVLAVGCHDGGKTFYLDAYMLIWRWLCGGSVLAEDGKPRGGILCLVSPKLDRTLATSWKAIRNHGQRAYDRGFHIPGFDPASTGASVLWRAIPQRWYITTETFQAPAVASKAKIVDAGSGLKHPTNLTVWGEEVPNIPRAWWRTIEGWGPDLIAAAFNPYHASGAAYDFTKGDEWAVAWFSYLRVPQVLNRVVETPGLADHLTLERELRHHCEDRGPYPETKPDGAHHDLVYALPTCEADDRPGPRSDEHYGSPGAPLRVFRPSREVDAGRLGVFPVASEVAVFSEVAWRAAERLHSEIGEPAYPPDVVGVDTAEGGPDRFVAVPRWGMSCADLWRRYQVALEGVVLMEQHPDGWRAPPISPVEALAAALKCPNCYGKGCDRCWSGVALIYFGQPVEIAKTDVADEMARRIMKPWEASPLYKLDAAAGGHWIRPYLEAEGARAVTISFGGGVREELPHQRLYLNQRAVMGGRLADAVNLGGGAVALPDHPQLRRQAGVLEWAPEARTDRAGGKDTRYKLPDKLDIKAMLSGQSPDHCDGWFATEGEVESREVQSGRLPGW